MQHREYDNDGMISGGTGLKQGYEVIGGGLYEGWRVGTRSLIYQLETINPKSSECARSFVGEPVVWS